MSFRYNAVALSASSKRSGVLMKRSNAYSWKYSAFDSGAPPVTFSDHSFRVGFQVWRRFSGTETSIPLHRPFAGSPDAAARVEYLPRRLEVPEILFAYLPSAGLFRPSLKRMQLCASARKPPTLVARNVFFQEKDAPIVKELIQAHLVEARRTAGTEVPCSESALLTALKAAVYRRHLFNDLRCREVWFAWNTETNGSDGPHAQLVCRSNSFTAIPQLKWKSFASAAAHQWLDVFSHGESVTVTFLSTSTARRISRRLLRASRRTFRIQMQVFQDTVMREFPHLSQNPGMGHLFLF